MARVAISLFGPVKYSIGDGASAQFAYDKVKALLFYLVTETDRPHRRESLAGLLWPDQEESAARHSLNQALSSLRRTLNDRAADQPVLVSTRETIAFNQGSDCWVDVRTFETLIDQRKQHAHRRAETCRRCMDWLAEAVALYHGSFLEQFSLAGNPAFEEWLLVKRERYRQMVTNALDCLIDFAEHRHDDVEAMSYLRRQIELDAWREESHRRLMLLMAKNGQRAAAVAHFDHLQELIRSELDIDVEPATRALHDQIESNSLDYPAYPRSPSNVLGHAHHLPAQRNTLVGRESMLRELRDLIESGEHRLVTLIGPGGIGKTRLSLQLAHDEGEPFVDGACFVPLAGVESTFALVQAIADARSITFFGARDPHDQLLDALQHQDLLLILDNFEHLLDGVDLILDILDRAPGVQLLVTSRERLNVYGEHVFPVQALDIPAPDDEPDAIERSGAVQLFIRSAKRANAGFAVRQPDLPDVVRICTLVGGMPLAIELAAAWSPILTCHEIAAEIERSLDFLATSMRNVPERHQSVRAAFDHSWRLLTEHERQTFMRLAVFRGGFNKDAAEQVTGATLPTLLALTSKSFLARNGAGRFEIHELLRQYGAEKLEGAPDDKTAANDAHAGYYTDFLIQREEWLKGDRQRSALDDLIAESENIRAGWNWALSAARVDLLEHLVQVWLFFEMTGRYQELVELLNRAIRILEKRVDEQSRFTLGRALSRYAACMLRMGHYEQGDSILTRSHEILSEQQEPSEIGLNLHFQAMCAHGREDFRAEQRLLEESLHQTRLAGDQWVTAYSLNDLGMAASLLGEHERAQGLIQDSLEIMIALGDWRGRAFALNNLGTVVGRTERYEEALRFHEESLQIRRQIDNPWGMAQSMAQIGIALRALGDYADSRTRLREALRIASDLRAYPLLLDILTEIADLYAQLGSQALSRTIMSRVASHPSSGPSIRSRARQILDGDPHQVTTFWAEQSTSTHELDEVVMLALRGTSAPSIYTRRATIEADYQHPLR